MSGVYWNRRGLKTRIAEKAEISLHHLCEILARRRGVSLKRAYALEAASAEYGRRISWQAWINNRSTSHPAFSGRKYK